MEWLVIVSNFHGIRLGFNSAASTVHAPVAEMLDLRCFVGSLGAFFTGRIDHYGSCSRTARAAS